MVKFVDDELKAIRTEVLDMWALVYDQMKNVCEAITTADKEKAWDVLIREKRVNAYELKLDCDIEDFLVLYNPVAIDMRFVLAMLKINTDLERIGDFAENIARFIIKQDGTPIDAELIQKTRLKEMADQMLDMLATAREALEKEDIAMANSLFEKDNIVDEINAGATAALAEYIAANPDKAAFCLDFKGVFLRLRRLPFQGSAVDKIHFLKFLHLPEYPPEDTDTYLNPIQYRGQDAFHRHQKYRPVRHRSGKNTVCRQTQKTASARKYSGQDIQEDDIRMMTIQGCRGRDSKAYPSRNGQAAHIHHRYARNYVQQAVPARKNQ